MDSKIEKLHSCAVMHCGSFETDRHHIKQKSDGGSDNPANIMYLCRRHHGWAHKKIYYAHDLGMILFSYEDEPTVPIENVEIRPIKKRPVRPQADISELESKFD